MGVDNNSILDYKKSIYDFISEIESKKVRLWVEGQELCYRAPKGIITQEILNLMKERKHEIVKFLKVKNGDHLHSDIQKVAEKEYYPMSSAQKRMYLLYQMDMRSTAYNITQAIRIDGELDRAVVHDIITRVVERHESLRTSFEVLEGNPIQRIHSKVDFDLEYEEIEESEENIEYKINEFIQPFDLAVPPLFRFKLIRLKGTNDSSDYILLHDIHHIISDGISEAIFVKEINDIYAKKNLTELNIQYKDYAEWQTGLLSNGWFEGQKQFWIEQLQGELPVLNLITDFKRPTMFSFKGDSIRVNIDKGLTERLNRLAYGNKVTLYTVLLAAYNVLLFKYTGQNDFIVGCPVGGRRHSNVHNVIGLFVNTVVHRNFPKSDMSFQEFLCDVGRNAIKVFDNQDYPFEKVIDNLNIQRDTSRNPIFDSVLVLQNMNIEDVKADGLKITPYRHEKVVAQFDLSITATENRSGIEIEINYCTDLFKRATIERLSRHLSNILTEVTEKPDLKLCDIDMLTLEEKNQILYSFNDTAAVYPKERTIQQLFEEQAGRTPGNIALILGNKKATYEEVNRKSNQIARVLREKGIKPDCIVAIMMERSIEMIIGALGVLKAGGAYLPIDPQYPEERIKYTLEDSGARVLLTSGILKNTVDFKGDIIDLEDSRLYCGECKNLAYVNGPEDLAYIIYTSGTTGKPKGVMITHRNVARLLFNERFQFDFSDRDVWTMFHSFCFDFSVWEMYGALLYGGKLVIVPKQVAQDPEEYLKLLVKEKVTVLNQTPTAFYHLANSETRSSKKELEIRYVIFGGEALKPIMLRNWKRKYPDTKLVNMYGITETTVHVTYKEITENEIEQGISNIGKPIPTLATYVMDRNMRLLPIGVPGELCVGGDGVGRGYLNRPELTAEKFVENPYKCGEMLYRSGDLARLLPNGDMEYLGRIDHQVKIRGHRIELGEIESRLLKHTCIEKAIVMAREDEEGNKYLCAYIVSAKELAVSELRQHLTEELPDYMVPAYFMRIDEIPLTSNGKVDTKVLPDPEKDICTGVEYEGPQNDIQEKLVKVWQEVLGIERAGINDNFFELGGDSIKAIQVSSRLKNYGLKLELKDLFKYRNIKEISNHIKDLVRNTFQGVVEGEVDLTPIQKWFFERKCSSHSHYNQAVMIYSQNGFDTDLIKDVFHKILEHHDALRMVFRVEDDRVKQFNRGVTDNMYTLEEFDFTHALDYKELIEKEADRIQQSIDLENGPLVKIGLFKTCQGDHVMIAIHHLVVDGVSWRIILEDLAQGYTQLIENKKIELQYKTDSFKEWASNLNAYANSRELLKEAAYWRELGKIKLPPLVRDKSTDSNKNQQSGILTVALSEEETFKLINNVSHAYNTEINDILLAALGMAVKQWKNIDRVLINLEGHGREEVLEGIDITRTVGWFTSMYPVLIDMSRSEDISYHVRSVKEGLRSIPGKGIGYGVMRYLTSQENRKGLEFSLEPEISFNYLGQFDMTLDTPVFRISDISPGKTVSPYMERSFVLDMNCILQGGRLNISIDFNRNEYYEESITRFLDLYKRSLTDIIYHCEGKKFTELTPTDLGNSELTIDEVEDIADLFSSF